MNVRGEFKHIIQIQVRAVAIAIREMFCSFNFMRRCQTDTLHLKVEKHQRYSYQKQLLAPLNSAIPINSAQPLTHRVTNCMRGSIKLQFARVARQLLTPTSFGNLETAPLLFVFYSRQFFFLHLQMDGKKRFYARDTRVILFIMKKKKTLFAWMSKYCCIASFFPAFYYSREQI